MPHSHPNPIFKKLIAVSASVIDGNGHVNNVAYVQWMQDIAVEHYASIHGVEDQGANSTWVVREHKIEYLLPAFEGEEIEIQTWIADVRRVRSLRCYKFIRRSDGSLLVRGETNWVFIDTNTGAPRAIPPSVASVMPILPDRNFRAS
ncbi:MAG: acyl-CoA thioesterase [Verrucomicrobiota bacterium]